MINFFHLTENDTQLGLVNDKFTPLTNEPLETQSKDPKLWTLHLVNVENAADGRAFTLDLEEKEYISTFLKNHKLT